MSAKTEILAAVRAAIAQSQPAAPDPQVVRDYRFHAGSPAGSEAVVAEFVEALEDYHAHVVQVTAEQVPEAIDDLLESAEATSVVVPSGLPQAWQEAAAGQISRGRGRKRSDPRDVHVDSREEPLDKEYLADVDAVVTAARAGVSLSGTIVLDGEPDQGRRAITLLPDVHVCVVRASQVQGTVPEAVAILGEHAERPQTWIAGPSATSDIELVRVDGVHGPRTLCVVIVTDD
ncbi:MAG: lactate utilization protein C [Propionibacterium sp.]|nr:lactate utilization protein C [Propionibacterium sp.]MDN6794437.1 lactate utilization protein C [Propionibacterium sp.]